VQDAPLTPTDAAPPLLSHSWHALSAAEVLSLLEANAERGLASEEARRRLELVWPNRVGDQPERPLWRLFLEQFRSLVVLLLLGGAAVAWVLGERAERSPFWSPSC
jgi:P-type Ca2+ transporter type 2C